MYVVHIFAWLGIDSPIKHHAPLTQWMLCPVPLRCLAVIRAMPFGCSVTPLRTSTALALAPISNNLSASA
jgi:hypothetical protein